MKHVPSSNELHIVDPPKKATIAYPISTFTYCIVPHGDAKEEQNSNSSSNTTSRSGKNTELRSTLLKFPKWWSRPPTEHSHRSSRKDWLAAGGAAATGRHRAPEALCRPFLCDGGPSGGLRSRRRLKDLSR